MKMMQHDNLDLTGKRLTVATDRSEEHTSELQSRPHISYAVFCLKKKKKKNNKKKKEKRKKKKYKMYTYRI